MKKFIVLYYAPSGAMEKMAAATPEEAKDGMKPWMDWANKVGSGMVDLGTPLGNGKKVSRDGVAGSTKDVVGYTILQADNIDEATKLLKEHPHLQWMESCEIEVYESLPLPGM